ncbi:MAG TPA: DUF3141 domain-containing protein, partial [Desulfosarcina sp.]|nr:DUF3141 domain-containing protein [Desulfosarcina sp.]
GFRQVRFEARDMADITVLDDGQSDEKAFARVAALSRFNDRFYRLILRPWIIPWTTEFTAEILRQWHPLRLTRYGFSDLNPLMGPVRLLAQNTVRQRRPAAPDNPFLSMQAMLADTISYGLNLYRDLRDTAMESWFYALFDNPWVQAWWSVGGRGEEAAANASLPKRQARLDRGGFAEAVIRIMAALVHAGSATRRRSLAAYASLADLDPRLAHLRGETLDQMVKTQYRLLRSAPEAALAALSRLLHLPEDRQQAVAIASSVITDADPKVKRMRGAIAAILGVE